MDVLLISTYELGRQPVHISSPAASLRAARHNVRVIDVAVDPFDRSLVEDVDAVAISVPMHTATRLALLMAAEIEDMRPELPIALYGLYAGVPDHVAISSVDAIFAGEYEPELAAWLDSIASSRRVEMSSSRTGRSEFHVPDRSELPSLDRYARLEFEGETRLAGAVEASHGCRHRCRHCPIPSVYDGRMRVVPKEVVLADIAQLVDAGASHITFGDPDFLNAPRHSLDVLDAAHEAHPRVTFDATIKVSHIIEYADIWAQMADRNLLFVVSAFESAHEPTLEILDKGHTVSDMDMAVSIVRNAGMFIRPTWLPFVPWTEPSHVVDIFRFIDGHDLASSTDPVQMSIKLLIPRGSLLEEHPQVVPHLRSYDQSSLTWSWAFSNPDTESLQMELVNIASTASDCGQESSATMDEMRSAVSKLTDQTIESPSSNRVVAPRLTESWFCCAEPTQSQMVTLGVGPR